MKNLNTLQYSVGQYSKENSHRDLFGCTYKTIRSFKRVLASSELNEKSIEFGSKQALKKFIYPVIDDIKVKTKGIQIDTLFRPLMFDLMYFALTGFHLKSLDDPFFVEFNQESSKILKNVGKLYLFAVMMGKTEIPNACAPWLPLKLVVQKYFTRIHEEILTKKKSSLYAKLYNEYKDAQNELIFDCAVVMQAAFDTSLLTLQHVLHCLTKYQNYQEMIFNELNDLFGNGIDNENSMKSNSHKLHNLNAFIHEVLRMFPPSTTAISRRVDDPNGIMIDGYHIPKNGTVSVNIYAINRDEKYWKYGNQFNIDNFKNDKGEFYYDKGKNQSFATFGFGPRMCPVKFALFS